MKDSRVMVVIDDSQFFEKLKLQNQQAAKKTANPLIYIMGADVQSTYLLSQSQVNPEGCFHADYKIPLANQLPAQQGGYAPIRENTLYLNPQLNKEFHVYDPLLESAGLGLDRQVSLEIQLEPSAHEDPRAQKVDEPAVYDKYAEF